MTYRERKQNEFKIKCLEAAKLIGQDDVLFCDDDRKCEFEDDGYLHVCRYGVRAVFNAGDNYDLDAEIQNERTVTVMNYLGLKVNNNLLVEERSH